MSCMKRNENGFQVLELILVLALIGVAGAVGVGAWSEWAQHYRLQAAADTLTGFLLAARGSALTRNTAIQIRVREDRSAVSMTPRGEEAPQFWEMLPQGVRLAAVPSRPISFFSRGNAAPAGTYLLQNRRGQTIVAPYVVRPVHGATVSSPLDWDELAADLHPSRFTIQTMTHRIELVGDPFEGALVDRQHLMPAIEALEKLLS